LAYCLTSTIFLGVAAASKTDAGKWDDKQVWETAEKWDFHSGNPRKISQDGWEPFAIEPNKRHPNGTWTTRWFRRRVK
jgi:hypothetical protein